MNTSGTQTTTGYLLGGQEERTNAGTITKYLGAKGLPTAIRVGTAGSLNYLASDGLGSVSVAVDGSGNVVASQLFDPYGTARYSSGTMPTSKGFTGQRADVASGLDYYGARYYDPVAGQFVSADSPQYGLSRYGYVGGNPETATDPSGHIVSKGNGGGSCDHSCMEDARCANQPAQCRSIVAIWGVTSVITQYLLALTGTDIGDEVLQYVLYMGAKVGSGFISLSNDLGPCPQGGLCSPAATVYPTGNIILNSQAQKGGFDAPQMAGAIVHEALESYFTVVDGIFGGTLNADYAAEWFSGEFMQEYNQNNGTSYNTYAYGQYYKTWLSQDGKNYSGEGSWDGAGYLVGSANGPTPDLVSAVPDPMGLTVAVLNPSNDPNFNLGALT